MTKIKKKTSLGKKILKWSISIFLVILLVLIMIPFLFKDKIVKMVSNTINSNVNATVTFQETDLSLLRSFPLASLKVNNILVINNAPFLGDTLFMAREVSLNLKITALFKNASETLKISSASITNGMLNIKVNKDN
ncbi:MAG: hypothetical protein ACI9WV_002254, partial [Patiriisocius sp.]